MGSLLNVSNNRTILIVDRISEVILMDKNNKKGEDKHKAAVFYITKMLNGLPEDLVDMFTPQTADELHQLEVNIEKWLIESYEREKIMRLQQKYNLPLRPNQSLRDLMIRIKIVELKKARQDGDDLLPNDGKGDGDSGV